MQPLIPVDVLVNILEHVDRSDLPTLCQVNKLVCNYARDVLYRQLELSSATVLGACCTINIAPHLANRVKSFSVYGNDIGGYLGIIQDALMTMTRLRALQLFIGHHGSWILPAPNASPFHLHAFACGFNYDSDLVTFLNGQSELKVASLMECGVDKSYPFRFNAESLPNLTRLSAPLSLIQKLVVDRPVRDVVTYHFGHNPTWFDCLSQSSAPNGVQRLEINLEYLRIIGGQRLASTLPGLNYLTVAAMDLDPGDDQILPHLTKWVVRLVSAVRTLHWFTIQFNPTKLQTPWWEIDFLDLVTKAFESASNLHCFILTVQGQRDASYKCLRVPGRTSEWALAV